MALVQLVFAICTELELKNFKTRRVSKEVKGDTMLKKLGITAFNWQSLSWKICLEIML